MARLSPSYYMSPEEQDALLGGALLEGGTDPLSDPEKEAIGQLDPLPVTEGPGPKVNEVLQGNAEPVVPVQEEPPPAPEPTVPQQQPKTEAPPQAPKPAAAPVPTAPAAEASKLAPTKPEWYDDLAPPEQTGVPDAIGAAGLGLLGALLIPKKHGKLKAASLGLGAMGAADALMRAPDANYDRRLKAAQGQAEMHRTLSGRGGDSELDWLKFELSKERLQGQQAELARKLELERQDNDINSERTKQHQDMAIQIGMPEAEARKYTAAQILKWRPQIANELRQGEGNQNAFDKIALQDHLRKQAEERAQGREIEGEERKRVASLETAAVPGVEWINPNRPPDEATVRKVREIHGARESLIDAATRLAQLQRQVKDPVTQTLGGWNAVFGDVDQADILQEMKFLREQLAADQRVIWNQGVPHEFDLLVNKKTNPEADSPFTFFTGEGAWGAMARTADRRTDLMMKSLGARRAGQETPTLAPAPARGSVGKKDLSNEVRSGGETSRAAAQEVGEAVGAAAGNTAQAARTIAIQIQDPVSKAWSSTRQVTEEQYRNIMKKLAEKGIGPGAVRRAQ